jgi:hypothetical protein
MAVIVSTPARLKLVATQLSLIQEHPWSVYASLLVCAASLGLTSPHGRLSLSVTDLIRDG